MVHPSAASIDRACLPPRRPTGPTEPPSYLWLGEAHHHEGHHPRQLRQHVQQRLHGHLGGAREAEPRADQVTHYRTSSSSSVRQPGPQRHTKQDKASVTKHQESGRSRGGRSKSSMVPFMDCHACPQPFPIRTLDGIMLRRALSSSALRGGGRAGAGIRQQGSGLQLKPHPAHAGRKLHSWAYLARTCMSNPVCSTTQRLLPHAPPPAPCPLYLLALRLLPVVHLDDAHARQELPHLRGGGRVQGRVGGVGCTRDRTRSACVHRVQSNAVQMCAVAVPVGDTWPTPPCMQTAAKRVHRAPTHCVHAANPSRRPPSCWHPPAFPIPPPSNPVQPAAPPPPPTHTQTTHQLHPSVRRPQHVVAVLLRGPHRHVGHGAAQQQHRQTNQRGPTEGRRGREGEGTERRLGQRGTRSSRG